jgi:hypothetical protein
MSITYGCNPHDQYITAGKAIAKDFNEGNMSEIVNKINNNFFNGGDFA